MAVLLVATGDGFARVTELDQVWDSAGALPEHGVQCLAVDPLNAQTLYAGTHGKGIWKSIDGGRHWYDLWAPHADIFSLAISIADGALYAGCEPSMIFRSGNGGRSWQELAGLREIPSAPTWSFPPRPWTSHVRWIAPSPHDPLLLLAGIELGGLMYSNDAGQTWADHRPGAQRDVHALAWHPHVPGRAYEAGGGGAAWSHDGGWTWGRLDEGRALHYTWALAVNPDDPDCWFISAAPGPREAHAPRGGAQAQIYRWRGVGPWEALSGGLPQPLSSLPYALTFAGGRLYAGLGDGRIFMSRDNGDTWQALLLTGDPLERVEAMICLP